MAQLSQRPQGPQKLQARGVLAVDDLKAAAWHRPVDWLQVYTFYTCALLSVRSWRRWLRHVLSSTYADRCISLGAGDRICNNAAEPVNLVQGDVAACRQPLTRLTV